MGARGRGRIAVADSTVLLTGATGGIGTAIARGLAARGARLLVTGRRREALDRLAAELDPAGRDRVRVLVCELSDRDELERLGAEAVAAGVDVLVANAAMPASGELVDLEIADAQALSRSRLKRSKPEIPIPPLRLFFVMLFLLFGVGTLIQGRISVAGGARACR